MSIEAPEARILGKQLDESLRGKLVKQVDVRDYEKMQRVGFIEKDLSRYQRLVGETVKAASSRGNTILVKHSNDVNLVIGPEYGGRLRILKPGEKSGKYHLKVDYLDGFALTVRLLSMGMINVAGSLELPSNYLYKRDFASKLSPLDEDFKLTNFTDAVRSQSKNLKTVLVGKDAVVVGISNSTFQDVLYQAKLNPKRRGSDLSQKEAESLYDSIKNTYNARLKLGGKVGFSDIYGAEGRYEPMMGPNMKNQLCPKCGTRIEEMSFGGGKIYYCSNCQS
jgi:formamidopyrimidine-DNA glycosylase